MKRSLLLTSMLVVAAAAVAGGCASSYQDRLDALNQPPEPAVSPPAEDDGLISRDEIPLSGACIVNADCSSTTFCKLGACVFECSAKQPCAGGLSCSARGKCVADAAYTDVDPPITTAAPVSWEVDSRVIKLAPAAGNASFNLKVLGGGTLQYRVQVDPAAAAPAVTVSSPEGVLASGGETDIDVKVDRNAFGAGDHRILVSVISDGGQRNVIYEFSNGIEGRYAGFVEYEEPGLGRIPFVLDIKDDGNAMVHGRIVAADSLLFPEERGLSGSYNAAQRTIFLMATDLAESGGSFDPFGREIGREIYLYGSLGETGVIKGDFEELISGLLPQLVSVQGTFHLERTLTEIGNIAALADVDMPAYVSPAVAYAACAGASPTCNDFVGGFPSDMSGCSQELRSQAFKLGSAFAGVNLQGDPIVDFGLVESCDADLAGSGAHACVNIDDLLCLRTNQQAFLLSQIPQNAEFLEYVETLKGLQRTYAFTGNDRLVEAYRTPLTNASNTINLELLRLEDALDQFVLAERTFFDARNINVLAKMPGAVFATDSFELFRVPLEYMRSSQAALTRIASLTVRRDLEWPQKQEALRRRLQEHARIIYFEGVALARLISAHGASFESQLAQVADELKSSAREAATLTAGLNPAGFPNDYVPFIYDPADAQHSTNVAQLVEMAAATVESAVEKAQAANSATETLQVRTEEIQQRLDDIAQRYDSEIQQICGIGSLELLGECGQTGGELAIAFNEIDQQYLEIEKIYQQMADLNQMVKIKRDNALQIMNIKNQTLAFTASNGSRLEVLDVAEGEIRAAMLKRSGLFGAIGGFLKGIADIASGFTGLAFFDPEKYMNPGSIVGGIAGGVSGCIDSGLGLASSAQSASAARNFAEIARERTQIRTLQDMRFQQEGMEIAAIEAAETVKMLLLQMAQLNLDLSLAETRLSERVIQASNLLGRVDYLKHQRDVMVAQQLRSVLNPLSNLSFRLNRDHMVLIAAEAFEKALGNVYLAARGLEHELNVELPQIEAQLFQATSAAQLKDFLACLDGWYDDYAMGFGSPHEEVTQLSLREDVLGFTKTVTDEVTGEEILPQEIFRRVLLNPKHITSSGRVEFPFVTSIAGGSRSFSMLTCNDRITSVRVMLVGDFLGDNEATILLRQEGDSYLRDCAADPAAGNDLLSTYHLDSRAAHVQAGVNTFGIASPNYELTGRSVASDRWVLVIPTGSEAPNNVDLDLLHIDDVIIEIAHTARTLRSGSPTNVFGQCNI